MLLILTVLEGGTLKVSISTWQLENLFLQKRSEED